MDLRKNYFQFGCFSDARLVYKREQVPVPETGLEEFDDDNERFVYNRDFHLESVDALYDDWKDLQVEYGDQWDDHFRFLIRYNYTCAGCYDALHLGSTAKLENDTYEYDRQRERALFLQSERKRSAPQAERMQELVDAAVEENSGTAREELLSAYTRSHLTAQDEDAEYLAALDEALETVAPEGLVNDTRLDVKDSTLKEMRKRWRLAQGEREKVRDFKKEGPEFEQKHGKGEDGGFYKFAAEVHGMLADYHEAWYEHHRALLRNDPEAAEKHKARAKGMRPYIRATQPQYFSAKQVRDDLVEEMERRVAFDKQRKKDRELRNLKDESGYDRAIAAAPPDDSPDGA